MKKKPITLKRHTKETRRIATKIGALQSRNGQTRRQYLERMIKIQALKQQIEEIRCQNQKK